MSEETTDGGLAAEVASADPDVRWRVAAVLADLPGEESESLLVRLLGDEDYRVRERAVAALSRRFTPRVAAACALALADDANAGRRGAGLTLLTRAGDPGRAVLLGGLQHPSADVRLSAAMALPGHNPDATTIAAIDAASRHEADPNARAALLLALGRTGRREAMPGLLAVLEEGSIWLRVHAIEALGEIGDPEVAVRLLPLLSQEAVRKAVLKALSRLESSAPAEELARRAARGELDGPLLSALRHAVEVSPAETSARVRSLWPDAPAVLASRLGSTEVTAAERTDAAHLLALLDLPGAVGTIVRSGPYADGFGALLALPSGRSDEALLAVLQEEDPEPALAFVDRARATGETGGLAPLLVHSSPSVRAAALIALPPRTIPLRELDAILAEDDEETALPAALALASRAPGEDDDAMQQRRTLLGARAAGPDGPARAAALLACAELAGGELDELVSAALGSPDARIRRAAVAASAGREAISEDDLVKLMNDPDAEVRATVLRTLGQRAIKRGSTRLAWRVLLPFLTDEPAVAAAAGAAIVALAGAERPRLAEEMLAQQGPIRRAALEAIVSCGDREAAERVAFAVGHEDADTARAVLQAMVLASPEVAEESLVRGLQDERPEVRQAAAETAGRRPPPQPLEGPLSAELANALAAERIPEVREALLEAAVVAGGRSAVAPLTAILARERLDPCAEDAAEALAYRFPTDARQAWTTAPARAERRWARALTRASARRREAGSA